METAFGIVPAREQLDMLAYLNKCAQAMDCRIRKLAQDELTKLVPAKVCRKEMNWEEGSFIVGLEAVSAYLELYTTYVCESNIDNRLRGFVVVGDFNPALDEDIHWPKWKDKTLPDNRGLSEIKLLGCEKGFGRLMFSWALVQCSNIPSRKAVVLEVLGGQINKKAVDFYKEFGFKRSIAYDTNLGPCTQMNENNEAITMEELQVLVDIQRLRKSNSRAPSTKTRTSERPRSTKPKSFSPPTEIRPTSGRIADRNVEKLSRRRKEKLEESNDKWHPSVIPETSGSAPSSPSISFSPSLSISYSLETPPPSPDCVSNWAKKKKEEDLRELKIAGFVQDEEYRQRLAKLRGKTNEQTREMKRALDAPPEDLSRKRTTTNLLDSLEQCDPAGLLAVINTATRLYNRHCTSIVASLPTEVLENVFRVASGSSLDSLLVLGLVCSTWNLISSHIVEELYSHLSTTRNSVLNKCVHFTDLSLDQNLTITDMGLSTLTNLTRLDISHNELISDVSLFHLAQLAHLSLEENNMITDESVSRLTCLVSLNLSLNTKITDRALRGLTNLTYLDLQENDLVSDCGISRLTNLSQLRLKETRNVTDFGLSYLTNLTDLGLTDNQTITDECLLSLSNLTKLDLWYNQTITDRSVSTLTNIVHLNLSQNCKISNSALACLTNLTRLILWRNHTITDEGLSGLTNLAYLELYSNMTITNNGLLHLTNMKRLNLRHNRTITDDCLSSLTSLTTLDLWSNKKITDGGLSTLTNLTNLGLACNQTITDLGLSSLLSLTELNLTRNSKITDSGLTLLTNLRKITVQNNTRVSEAALASLPNLIKIVR